MFECICIYDWMCPWLRSRMSFNYSSSSSSSSSSSNHLGLQLIKTNDASFLVAGLNKGETFHAKTSLKGIGGTYVSNNGWSFATPASIQMVHQLFVITHHQHYHYPVSTTVGQLNNRYDGTMHLHVLFVCYVSTLLLVCRFSTHFLSCLP